MTREAKVGLMMVALLVGVFGFLLYKKIHRPPEILADQTTSAEMVDDGVAQVQVEDDLKPRRRRDRISRDVDKIERNAGKAVKNVEKAAKGVEELTVDTIEEFNPFAGEKKKREKPRLPVELPSEEDEFAQFEQQKNAEDRPRRLQPPDPADTAFDDTPVQRTPSRAIAADSGNTASDPFFDDTSTTTSVRPVDFTDQPRRERAVPVPNDFDGRSNARDNRSAPELSDMELQPEEPRRVRESDNGFDQAPRERRRAAPTTFADDSSFPDSSSQSNDSGDRNRYVVQPNDNFWSISRKRYGAGRYYMALAAHNRDTIPDPKMMKPGIVVATPDVTVLEQRYADVIPKVGSIDSTSSVTTTQSRKSVNTEPSGYFVGNDGTPMYRIGDQDTLTGIAKSHLGRTTRWVQILEMNRNVLRDGNELKIGMVLRLPADASRVQIVGTIREYR